MTEIRARRLSMKLLLGGALVAVLLIALREDVYNAQYVNRAAVAIHQGRNAVEMSKLAWLKGDPGNVRVRYWLSTVAVAKQGAQRLGAEQNLVSAVRPGDRLVSLRLAELYLHEGQLAAALSLRKEALGDASVTLRGQLAGRLCESSAPACVVEFDDLLATPGLSAQAKSSIYHQALDGLTTIRSPRDAERYARAAVDLFPEDGYYRWHLATALSLDQPEEALQQAHIVERLGYDRAATYELLGKIYRGLSRWDQAIEAFEQSLAVNAGNPWVRFWLGDAYWQTGCRDEAISQWQAALQIAPGFQEAQQALDAATTQMK